MVWMLLENRVFWRLVEKVMVVDRGSSVAVCQMDQIDLLSELVKLDYSAWQRPLLRQALAPVQGPLLLLGAAGAGIAPDLNIQQQSDGRGQFEDESAPRLSRPKHTSTAYTHFASTLRRCCKACPKGQTLSSRCATCLAPASAIRFPLVN
jgi:hypothetical protein